MRTALLIVCSFMLLMACKKKDSVPGNILSKEKMQAVLKDMMRADQFLSDFVFSRDTSPDKKTGSVKLYRQVLATHQLTKEEFQKSFSFYRSHPELLKAILDSIAANKRTIQTAITPRPDTLTNPGKKFFIPDRPGKKKVKKPLRIE